MFTVTAGTMDQLRGTTAPASSRTLEAQECSSGLMCSTMSCGVHGIKQGGKRGGGGLWPELCSGDTGRLRRACANMAWDRLPTCKPTRTRTDRRSRCMQSLHHSLKTATLELLKGIRIDEQSVAKSIVATRR
jgi:hypothetical protein